MASKPSRPLDESSRLLLAAALGLAILLVSGLLLAQELPRGTPFDSRAALERSQAALGNRVGDYTLTGVDGERVRLASYRGKPLIVSFVYTGCFQVCPTTTRFLERAVREAQRALGPDSFDVVSVGFNLPFDSPAAMRDFQTRHGVTAPRWRFLAADRATVDGLARDLGFAWVATAAGFDHVTQATIVDARGVVARQVYGDSFELPMFVAPIKELVTGETTPVQNLADVVERIRILCTVYDPRAGRYRLNYALFIEIAAGLSILGATAWYVGSEWRRQRAARST
jgi:protein SCO1/2